MLEIRVFDTLILEDDLDKVIKVLVESFKRWSDGDRSKPFSVIVTEGKNKSPPPIEINVSETIKAKAVFG